MTSPPTRPTPQDRHWLTEAIALSRLCPPSPTAFCVGAVIVDHHGKEMARGYSREADAHVHAEEAALAKLAPHAPQLANATLYTSLEPCGLRKSRPATCAGLIVAAGITRVVFAWREPPLFVTARQGAHLLTAAGVTVIEIPDLAPAARAANTYLPGIDP
ncbi:deaminase [Streptomyces sp. RGM 3693]|uniref:deaminase n=1 Tax=Streptomyces sp. RGM 3693 TaxID=3413284 RepID=UPI003D2DBB32